MVDNIVAKQEKYLYILTNYVYAEREMYKVGRHTGTKAKLISRYKTPLIDPEILLFLPCSDMVAAENELKFLLFNFRVCDSKGKRTEWVIQDRTVLVEMVRRVINKHNKLAISLPKKSLIKKSEVRKPVPKSVPTPKSVPKFIQQPVAKSVPKFIQQPVAKSVPKFIQQPVAKPVAKPVPRPEVKNPEVKNSQQHVNDKPAMKLKPQPKAPTRPIPRNDRK